MKGEGAKRAAPILAAFAYTWSAIFIRWADPAEPLVIAFYRMLIATAFWTPFYFLARRNARNHRPSRRQWRFIILAGLFLACHFATWTTSLVYTTVASSVFLILTQPMMVAVAAHFLLGERLTRVHWIALVLAIAGSAMIFGGDLSLSRRYLFGDLLAFIGAMLAGGYFIMARLARPDRGDDDPGVHLALYLFPVYGISALGLLAGALVAGQPLGPFPANVWWSLLALGLVPTVIGHSLFNWSLRHLSALAVNITLVIEPVGASVLAGIFFHETPSSGLLIGSPFLILAVVLIYLRPPLVHLKPA